MSLSSPVVPDDLADCQAALREQLARNDQLESVTDQQAETIQQQQQRIEKLEHEIQLFRRHIFGPRRERFIDDPRQQMLFDGGDAPSPLEDESTCASSKKKGRGHGRRPLPDFLPRRDVIHELSPEELPCPCCGKPRLKVSEQISEQLEYEPASLYVNRHVRYVYVCQEDDCGANMATAPKPPQPIEKGLAGPSLLAFVAASKLADHLPLNRQEDILTRHGIHIARSTQCDWMAFCAELARPLYELIVRRTLESKVLGTDDTTVPVLDRELDRTRTGYFWAHYGDDAHPLVCYDFTTSHSRDGPKRFLQHFQGYLQSDAYSGYIEIARQSNGLIEHVGCWAHTRRYYDRARDRGPKKVVHEALAYIQRLYNIDSEAESLTTEQRLAVRQEKSVLVLDEFRNWLEERKMSILPSSPLGEAISYTLNHWESLIVFTRDADLPLDNNRTEHAVRQQVLGRNNWLFVGSEKGGRTAAILYSLVGSCKRLRIDPFAYLRDVFRRLPTMSREEELEELLPDRWIQDHPKYRLTHREQEAEQAKQRRRERRARHRQLTKAKRR